MKIMIVNYLQNYRMYVGVQYESEEKTKRKITNEKSDKKQWNKKMYVL